MTSLKSTFVAIGLSLAAATAASAQSMTPEINDGIARIVTGNGASAHIGGRATTARTTGHRLVMRQATRTKAGTSGLYAGSSLEVLQNRVGSEPAEQPWQGWRRNF